MRLSVCLLTRNEAENLPRVLQSVRGIADEIVIADTGSTDETLALAEQAGARVQKVEWQDDFSAARNIALDASTSDWILWLNPDEELEAGSASALRASLDRPEVLAYVVRVLSQIKPDAPNHCSESVQPRLFRNRPDVRFVGRVHPAFRVPLLDLARQSSMQVLPAEFAIRHHAYLAQLNKGRLRWGLRLLELELKDRPGQLHYLIEYGRTLLLLDEPKGHEVMAEALAEMLRHRDEPHAPANNAGQLMEYLLTVSPEQSRCKLSDDEIYDLVVRWFAQSPPILWVLAEALFRKNQFRHAAFLLEQLVRCGRTGVYDRSTPFDPAVMGDGAILNLGACYSRMGQLDGALRCFASVAQSPTHGAQARGYFDEVMRMKAQGPR